MLLIPAWVVVIIKLNISKRELKFVRENICVNNGWHDPWIGKDGLSWVTCVDLVRGVGEGGGGGGVGELGGKEEGVGVEEDEGGGGGGVGGVVEEGGGEEGGAWEVGGGRWVAGGGGERERG